MAANRFNQFPWHSIFFCLFPILALTVQNMNEINIRVVYRPLLISVFFTILMLVTFKLIFKDWLRAGLLTTLFLMLFFSYGHVYNVFHSMTIAGVTIVRNRTLGFLWLIIAGLCAWGVALSNNKPWLVPLTRVMSLITALLVVFQLGSLFLFAWQVDRATKSGQVPAMPLLSSDPAAKPVHLPDIYYIILDEYGRSDVLRSPYGIDNTDFLAGLQDLGFTIADCSQSNYAQTEMSLASSLNLNYLDDLAATFTPGYNNDALLISLIKNSATLRILKQLGYQTVAFATGYQWTELENADQYFSPGGYWTLNEFETLVIRSSAGLILLDAGIFNVDQSSVESVRARTLYALDKLGSLPSDPHPKFVFAHLVIPHRPFVFGPHGETTLIGPLSSERSYTFEEFRLGYSNQVTYINDRITDVVSNIIAGSEIPPIIIIQGDHGPGFSSNQDRMGILNAYYLPRANLILHDSISPVNTFRMIFTEYFHGEFEFLKDASYFSVYDQPYEFKVIPNNCPPQ